MTLWYCKKCDTHFDSNEQDHADYENDMCENCVDLEEELRDAVVEAAKTFVNAELAAHHGPYEWARKEARQILFEAVDALEIAEKNL